MDEWTDQALQHQAPCHVCKEVQFWTHKQDRDAEGPWCGRCGRIICVTCDCRCGRKGRKGDDT